ncbi:hypothetical protein [Helicobacter sp. 23-1045]
MKAGESKMKSQNLIFDSQNLAHFSLNSQNLTREFITDLRFADLRFAESNQN